MTTRKLYRENVYKKEAVGKITGIKDDSNSLCLTFDQTVFFPTGGGQSCDTGYISTTCENAVSESFPIIETFEEKVENKIYHRTPKTPGALQHLKTGTSISMAIDWERRFENMQRHCGEHILSGVFFDLFGGVNRGFHMGADYMTIDIGLEDDKNTDNIDMSKCLQAEKAANRIIWQNLPVISSHFDKKEDAQNLPLRKKLAIDEDITIVSIGSTSKASDCVACCGTHPLHTGDVGMLKIYKVEPNKGMFRIFFDAGKPVLNTMNNQQRILGELQKKLSASSSDILDKYKKIEENEESLKSRIQTLTASLVEYIIEEIEDAKDSGNFFTKTFNDVHIDDINSLSGILSKSDTTQNLILGIYAKAHETLFLISKTYNCGEIINALRHSFDIKGGGGKTSGRIILQDAMQYDSIIREISNMVNKNE